MMRSTGVRARRCSLAFAALLPAVPVAVGAQEAKAPASSTPSAWLQFRNDTNNAGAVPGTLDVSWRYKAPHAVRGISVAAGSVVIGTEAADGTGDYLSPHQHGFISALDANTGALRWTHELTSWIHDDPAVYDGRVYVQVGVGPLYNFLPSRPRVLAKEGGILSFDLQSGNRLWSVRFDGGGMTAPVVDTASHSLVVAGGDGVLYQLSLEDGAIRRQAGLRDMPAMSNPRIGADRSILVGAGTSVISYSLSRDRFDWRIRVPPLKALGDVPIALSDTVAFITGAGSVGFWNAVRRLPIREFLHLAGEARRTYGLARYTNWFWEQRLLAVDRRSGRLLWQRPLGLGVLVSRNSSGMPVVVGNRVVVSSPYSKTIRAFDVGSGRELWMQPLDAMHRGGVTVVGEDVIIGDRTGTISLFRLGDGTSIGRCAAGAPFTVLGPVLVGRTLFTATRDGWVNATPYEDLRRRALEPGLKPCF